MNAGLEASCMVYVSRTVLEMVPRWRVLDFVHMNDQRYSLLSLFGLLTLAALVCAVGIWWGWELAVWSAVYVVTGILFVWVFSPPTSFTEYLARYWFGRT